MKNALGWTTWHKMEWDGMKIELVVMDMRMDIWVGYIERFIYVCNVCECKRFTKCSLRYIKCPTFNFHLSWMKANTHTHTHIHIEHSSLCAWARVIALQTVWRTFHFGRENPNITQPFYERADLLLILSFYWYELVYPNTRRNLLVLQCTSNIGKFHWHRFRGAFIIWHHSQVEWDRICRAHAQSN